MELRAITVGRLWKIPIRIHFSFLLALPLVAFGITRAFSSAARLAGVPTEGLAIPPFGWGIILSLALFACVLVHELAHSLYALAKGGKVQDITLLILGGVSRLSSPPSRPRDEAVMALVGPLMSLVLGLLFLGLFLIARQLPWFSLRFGVFYLATINLLLGAFNLLPAFPMDGGRVLRAALVPRMGRLRATTTAAALGKLFAAGFVIWGVATFNPVLALIGVFVFAGAQAEAQGTLAQVMLGRLQVRDWMDHAPRTISAQHTLLDAVEHMASSRAAALLLQREDGSFAVVVLGAIQRVQAARRAQTLASQVAVAVPAVHSEDDAGAAMAKLAEAGVPLLPVLEAGALVGVIHAQTLMLAAQLAELEEAHRRLESVGPPGRAPLRV